jgi:hypothetical protein
VSSSSVVGGQGAWRSTVDGVDEDREGEREEALGDALDESGEGLGEVVVEAHLALEVAEDRLDDESDAGLGDLDARALAEAVLVGGDELDVDQTDGALVVGAPEAAVSEQAAVGVGQAASRSCPVFGPTRS